MSEQITAPWSDSQVIALNRFQQSDFVHSFTCGGSRSDTAHRAYADHSRTEAGQLVATTSGWVCPVCSYTQKWAWASMLEEPRNPFDQIKLTASGTDP